MLAGISFYKVAMIFIRVVSCRPMICYRNVLLRPQLSYVTLTTVERISLPTASDFCELVTGLDFTFSTTALDSSCIDIGIIIVTMLITLGT